MAACSPAGPLGLFFSLTSKTLKTSRNAKGSEGLALSFLEWDLMLRQEMPWRLKVQI